MQPKMYQPHQNLGLRRLGLFELTVKSEPKLILQMTHLPQYLLLMFSLCLLENDSS